MIKDSVHHNYANSRNKKKKKKGTAITYASGDILLLHDPVVYASSVSASVFLAQLDPSAVNLNLL